jgi:23S rRNA (adenine2503-C2)-methyltransferase
MHILTHTSHSFSEFIHQSLGKGRQHAVIFYEAIFRRGTPPLNHPAFKNCPGLFNDILKLVKLPCPEIYGKQTEGHTTKFLLKTEDRLEVESVLIPMQSGGTLCISSQVGCRMGCSFCETGRMGLLRNLTTAEIVSQVFAAYHLLGCRFRNIVFMGMGEPFDNYDEVMLAAKILMDPKGFGFGKKHITISTSGCVEGILRMANTDSDTPNLAVSINAPSDEVRNRLMPINRTHQMAELHEAMHFYCQKTGRQILAAYVLLKGVNDRLEDADRLADYLRGLDVKINLIPYNSQSKDRYQAPDLLELEAFAERLRSLGYYTLLRLTKGHSIMAACGQLGNLQLRKKNRALSCENSPNLL